MIMITTASGRAVIVVVELVGEHCYSEDRLLFQRCYKQLACCRLVALSLLLFDFYVDIRRN